VRVGVEYNYLVLLHQIGLMVELARACNFTRLPPHLPNSIDIAAPSGVTHCHNRRAPCTSVAREETPLPTVDCAAFARRHHLVAPWEKGAKERRMRELFMKISYTTYFVLLCCSATFNVWSDGSFSIVFERLRCFPESFFFCES
jgi:hypothetical protein